MKALFKKLHLWLSVPFGIIITLICFSGAMLVFESEIVRMIHADLFRVEPSGKPLSVEDAAHAVSLTLPEDVRVSGVTVSAQPDQAYQVLLSKPRHASIYFDQYKGVITGRYERPAFFSSMFSMHRWLMDSRPEGDGIFWGKVIVGISTLLFMIVLITGVVIWWPRTKKALKTSLTITIHRGRMRFWHDLHVAGGMYVFFILLMMGLTGLTWSFGWYRTGFYKLFGVELQQTEQHGNAQQVGRSERGNEIVTRGEDRRGNRAGNTFANWQQVLEELQERNPDYKQISVSRGSASVSFDKLGNQRASDRYTIDPHTGEIIDVVLYRDSAPSGKIRGWIYSVHVGSFGGWFTRILWFLTALLGATLPLTGYYLWIKRQCRKQHSHKTLPDKG